MWSILKGEWRKLRRCQILLVGIVALALCPVVQYGTQLKTIQAGNQACQNRYSYTVNSEQQ